MIDIIKKLTVNEIRRDGSLEQQAIKECNKGNNGNPVSERSHIDQLHHRFQTLKDQPNNPANALGISVERNITELRPNETEFLKSPNGNKKALSPFYHKNIFDRK